MSTLRTLKQKLSNISRLWDQKDYDKALAEVEKLLEAWPGNPHLHVLKSSLVQLQEEPKYDLVEAKRALELAIELDKDAPMALIELGHFLDNVEDDPEAAVKAYSDGVAAARQLLVDGLIGQAKAYRQLNEKENFFRCVVEVLNLTRFGAGVKRYKAGPTGADIVVQLSSSPVFSVQVKGPYAEQLEELLSELILGYQTEPNAVLSWQDK